MVLFAAAAPAEKQPRDPEGQNLLTSYQRQAAGAPRLRRHATLSLSPASNKQLLELSDEQVLRRSQLPVSVACDCFHRQAELLFAQSLVCL